MKNQISSVLGREKEESLAGKLIKGVSLLSLSAAAGWVLYSRLFIDHETPLPDAIPAQRKVFQTRSAGRVSYYHNPGESTGRPLVLIHSVNAAASAFEMRPLFLHFREKRPVFAIDLPGYGFSERTDRPYSILLYQEAIIDFLRNEVGAPADVIALSLGCEFVAWAALAEPALFASLTFLSPTGFRSPQKTRSSQKARQRSFSDGLHALFAARVWARPFFDLLTTRVSIEKFLQRSFTGPVPEDLVDYAYRTSHQYGAEHVPLYFISGKLFTPHVREQVYNHLAVPVLAIYDRDGFTSFEQLAYTMRTNPNWNAARIVPTMGMPHFEQTENTAKTIEGFWDRL